MRPRVAFFGLLAGGLAACSGTPPVVYQQEQFDVTSAHSRAYATSPSATCEAARRALLSQGYVIGAAKSDVVEGRKSFQRGADTHVEIAFHVVCMLGMRGGGSIAFANALQDRYALKKSASSASVGVGAFGTLSLPVGSSEDAMIKVASETVTARDFYDRFFGLLAHYLGPESEPVLVEHERLRQGTHDAPPVPERPEH
jgi:hypothetical protein